MTSTKEQKTNAEKTEKYMEADDAEPLSKQATVHQTSPGVYSTPLEP